MWNTRTARVSVYSRKSLSDGIYTTIGPGLRHGTPTRLKVRKAFSSSASRRTIDGNPSHVRGIRSLGADLGRAHDSWSNNNGLWRDGNRKSSAGPRVRSRHTCLCTARENSARPIVRISLLYSTELYSTLTVFTTAFGIWYLCAAADRHNDPVTLRETTSTLAVPPITRAPRRRRAHYRRRTRGPPPYLRRRRSMVVVRSLSSVYGGPRVHQRRLFGGDGTPDGTATAATTTDYRCTGAAARRRPDAEIRTYACGRVLGPVHGTAVG
jgi:hypothetical protein